MKSSNILKVTSDYSPSGDQPQAIESICNGLKNDSLNQVLMGVTGSGKTYTMAKTIELTQRPALILAPNKTLAAQLYGEMKMLFPNNAVEYFVSYYDYYQPEAYVPRTNTFIEKDASINEQIDRMRHSTTRSLFERNDVIIVASVSCIYGIGPVETYSRMIIEITIDKETGNRVNLNWKGANTSDALIGTTGAERKAISNIIDVHFRNVDGVLSLPEARLINADPLQLNKEALTLQNVAQVGKQTGRETSSHPSYGYSIKGDPVGKIVEDISLLDLLPGAKKASGEPLTRANLTNADYRKMTMQQNYGLLTEKILRTLDDQGKLYGGLLK